MWRSVTPVSMLRVYLTVTGEVSLRNVYLYFFLQAFTRKSKNPCRFKNFQEYPRFYEHLGHS